MIYLRNPDPTDETWHHRVDDVFTDEQLKTIHAVAKATPVEQGTHDSIRQGFEARWLYNDRLKPVYEHLAQVFRMVNEHKFGFAIDFVAPLQHLTYNQHNTFDWHVDTPIKEPRDLKIRKISCSIMLNDEYEGGELTFASVQQGWKVGKLPANSAVFFPAFMPHTVTPITKGTRQSLIAWAVGPYFQ